MAHIPSTQKAVQISKTGGPEVIQLNEVPVGHPAADEVLVKVEWAGVNFIDTYQRGGLYPVELPKVLGNEAAGTIVAVGPDFDQAKYRLAVGDRVATFAPGGMSEYAVVKAIKASKLPDGVSTKDGATVLLQGLTALTTVKEAHAVQKGDWVLVHAAAGGLGLLLCQIASHLGAHVIGTTSTEEKAALAKKNGAEHVVLYGDHRPPVSEEVLKLTGGEGVHAVFDGVGKDTWEDNFISLRRKGTLVSIGNASGAVPPFQPLKLGAKNIKLLRPRLDNYVYTLEEWQSYTQGLFKLHQEGAFRIARHLEDGYPFTAEGVQQAHTDIAGRKTTGKLVIKIAA